MDTPPDDGSPRTLAEAFAAGLGTRRPRTSASEPAYGNGKWTLSGPLKSGNLAILDGAGAAVATVRIDQGRPADSLALAKLLARARGMAEVLETVLDAIEGDDDGARFPDLIAMIRGELSEAGITPPTPAQVDELRDAQADQDKPDLTA